ncbi:MAG TPA: hypothetical protein VFI26_08600 [Lysobacter sp.]|nr:hypothetical protein [Lysobacter sp.]
MSTPMVNKSKSLRLLAAALLAAGALVFCATGVLASVVACQRFRMPYNDQGYYFDGIANYSDGAQFVYGGIAVIAFLLAIWAARGMFRLLRPDGSSKPKPLRDSA